eukprot:Hpha_TRINITY_DN4645_c0_g1::TRINITY_DN4645_c0_g1_i1::g.97219::m.97219
MFRRNTLRLLQAQNRASETELLGLHYNPSTAWYFWTPVWGSQYNAFYEEPYYSAGEGYNNFRKTKPWEENGVLPLQWARDAKENSAWHRLGPRWAFRRMKDSAIVVNSTFATCHGEGRSMNFYMSTTVDQTGYSQQHQPHHMQWVFLPPDGRVVSCPYCRINFKRDPSFTPSFDFNLTPELGVVPNSLDPILEGVKKGEARAGQPGTVPDAAPLKGTKGEKNWWHSERSS